MTMNRVGDTRFVAAYQGELNAFSHLSYGRSNDWIRSTGSNAIVIHTALDFGLELNKPLFVISPHNQLENELTGRLRPPPAEMLNHFELLAIARGPFSGCRAGWF